MPTPPNPYRARRRGAGPQAIDTNIPAMPKPAKKSAVAPMAKQYAARARRKAAKVGY